MPGLCTRVWPVLLLSSSACVAAVTQSQWNFSPSNRTLIPDSVLDSRNCSDCGVGAPLFPLTLQATNGSFVTLDFGKDVGGVTTVRWGAMTSGGASNATVSARLYYSESLDYAAGGDRSNGGSGPDGALEAGPIAAGAYTPPPAALRGGFRYLRIEVI